MTKIIMKNRNRKLKIENYVIAMIFSIMNQHPTLQPYHTTQPYLLNLASTATLPSFLFSFFYIIFLFYFILFFWNKITFRKRFGLSFKWKSADKVEFYFVCDFEQWCVVPPRNILTPRSCQLIDNYPIILIVSPKPSSL